MFLVCKNCLFLRVPTTYCSVVICNNFVVIRNKKAVVIRNNTLSLFVICKADVICDNFVVICNKFNKGC